MALDRNALDQLAACLEYPTEETARAAAEAAQSPCISEGMRRVLGEMSEWVSRGTDEAEELYTRLFDMSPVCTLHVGYHLFGEDYLRGALLAMLRSELRRAEIDEKHDLPDFLPLLLRLLGRTGDQEDRALLVRALMLPALEKMTRALGESTDPFSAFIRELPRVLEAEVGSIRVAEMPERTVRLPCLT